MIRVLTTYSFREHGNGLVCLRHGWRPAPDGAWSHGPESSLELAAPNETADLALDIKVDPQQIHAVTRHRHIAARVNDGAIEARRLGGDGTWRIVLPPCSFHAGLRLTFIAQDEDAATAEGFRLQDIAVLRLGHAPLPPARRPLVEIRFSWNETTETWLGEGFGTPEDEYVWAIGGHSTMQLPVPPDGAPCLALLDMRPFHLPPDPPRQRVIVQSENSPPLALELRDRLTVAVDLRPAPGQTRMTLAFRNLDADFATTDPLFHFGKPFAWALASARILPALPRYLPDIRAPLPGSMAAGSLQQAAQMLTWQPASDLVRQFESLGNACELGQLQTRLQTDRVGLLRYAAICQRPLVEGILSGFHGVARADRLGPEIRREEDDTWRLVEGSFGISIPTPYSRNEDLPPRGLREAARRLPRLADKLMEDIAAGEFIFVLRGSEAIAEPAARAVLAALRHFGEAEMIWLVNDGTHPPGTVERLACGLIRGHLESPQTGRDVSPDAVLSVLANGFILLRQAQRLPP